MILPVYSFLSFYHFSYHSRTITLVVLDSIKEIKYSV